MSESGRLADDRVFKRNDDVRYRIIDGEAVVIRQGAAEVLGLNEVGARLLDRVDGTASVRELVDALSSEFDADRSQVERDVDAFLKELLSAGVITEG